MRTDKSYAGVQKKSGCMDCVGKQSYTHCGIMELCQYLSLRESCTEYPAYQRTSNQELKR